MKNKLCPFRKEVRRLYKPSTENAPPSFVFTERFPKCAEAKCMAYKNGQCMKLNKEAKS